MIKRYDIKKLKRNAIIKLIISIILFLIYITLFIVGYILDMIIIAAPSLVFLFLSILIMTFTINGYKKIKDEKYYQQLECDIEQLNRSGETSLALIYSFFIEDDIKKIKDDKYDIYTYLNYEQKTLEIDIKKDDVELNIRLSSRKIKYSYDADMRKLLGYDVRWKKKDIEFNSKDEIIELIKTMCENYLN